MGTTKRMRKPKPKPKAKVNCKPKARPKPKDIRQWRTLARKLQTELKESEMSLADAGWQKRVKAGDHVIRELVADKKSLEHRVYCERAAHDVTNREFAEQQAINDKLSRSEANATIAAREYGERLVAVGRALVNEDADEAWDEIPERIQQIARGDLPEEALYDFAEEMTKESR